MSTNNINLGLAYDDVLLIPQKSTIKHRADVSLKTKLTKNITLNTPFISANMDTVTESAMAIALAREGGIGIIHRFNSIEKQVKEITNVKRKEGFVVDKPYTLLPNATIQEARNKMKLLKIAGFIVVNKNDRVVGIITRRDMVFEENEAKEVRKVMTPFSKLIYEKPSITIKKAKIIFNKLRIEKLPLLNKNKKLVGLITARSVENFENNPLATKDRHGRFRVGAAIGAVGNYLERAKELVKKDVDLLVIDVAHGHNEIALTAIKTLRKKFKNIDLIGGNIATKKGASDQIKFGVSTLKVGIGPGGICTTRTVTGVGVPQLSAIQQCAQAAKKHNIPIIADGGTNFPGDITKALAAGASSIMLAGWFAGTDESPGKVILRGEKKFKAHRGSASFMAVADREQGRKLNTIVPEGVEALIPYKGAVSDVIFQLRGALQSGMSYCNARTIPQLQKNAHFIRMTEAGFRESKAHNIEQI